MDPAGKAKDPSRAMQNGKATVLVDLLLRRMWPLRVVVDYRFVEHSAGVRSPLCT